jgi:hypothetical protein
MTSGDRVVDRLQMPKEALDQMVRAVPDEVVRALVGTVASLSNSCLNGKGLG